MPGLLDFLQSASNAAAGNVSGPVDLLALGLRKLGVPVGDAPLGGSEWMRRAGLTRDVQQSPASLLGETAGLLAPIAAAAKAPQIAKGLLTMGENAAAPATLNPQTGAIVWHGSPHKFDRFDSSKIGTGEGAQAYGHGLYFADSPDVARGYQTKLAGGSVVDSRGIPADPTATTADLERKLRAAGLSWDEAEKAATGWSGAVFNGKTSELHPIVQEEIKRLGLAPKMQGALYKVDLPDSAIARMLDWDKPLSQQAPEVQKALTPVPELVGDTWRANSPLIKGNFPFRSKDEVIAEIRQMLMAGKQTGADLYDSVGLGGDALAAKAFREQGIPGIRYLDGGSRGAGTGTSNYVVFPGEEGLLKILERNGIPMP